MYLMGLGPGDCDRGHGPSDHPSSPPLQPSEHCTVEMLANIAFDIVQYNTSPEPVPVYDNVLYMFTSYLLTK